MEEIYERCCALDVHHASVSACVCAPDRSGKRSELRGRFSTMTSDWVWSFEPSVNTSYGCGDFHPHP
jgi:hypothetical protein